MTDILRRSFRQKPLSSVTSDTNLHRCLGVLDLVVIGVGSMIGSGIYIYTGVAIKTQAGPSIVLSFIIAAVIIMMIASCFIELASRLHKTGSSYLYLYVVVGELPAFLLGFSALILCPFGVAINARAFTLYVDSMADGVITKFIFDRVAVWTVGPPIARFPDGLAVLLILIITLVVALGVRFSAQFSTVFVFVNIFILVFIIGCAFIFGNIKNLTLMIEEFDPDLVNNSITVNWTMKAGGYKNLTRSETSNYTDVKMLSSAGSMFNRLMPFGWNGMIVATSSCFWSFSGFEMIASAVEESRSPRRDIPTATCLSLVLVTLLYVGVSASLTTLVPWASVDTDAPLAAAMASIPALSWARYLVCIGTLCGFTMALLYNVYGFARFALAMSQDGLLPAWFARVSPRTLVPVHGVCLCGLISAVTAFAFDVHELVEFSVNLLLIGYAAVCACVIVLRYRHAAPDNLSASELDILEDTEEENILYDAGLVLKANRDPDCYTIRGEDAQYEQLMDDGINRNSLTKDADCSISRSNFVQEQNSLNGKDGSVVASKEENCHDVNGLINNTDHCKSNWIAASTGVMTCSSDTLLTVSENDAVPEVTKVKTPFLDKHRQLLANKVSEDNKAETVKLLYNAEQYQDQWPKTYLNHGCLERLVGSRCVSTALAGMILFGVGLALVLEFATVPLEHGAWWAVVTMVVTALGVLAFLVIICLHRQSTTEHAGLRIPCVPLIPSSAILFCIILLVANCSLFSWIGTGVVIVMALVVYLTFSVNHSKLNAAVSICGPTTRRRNGRTHSQHHESMTRLLSDKEGEEEEEQF